MPVPSDLVGRGTEPVEHLVDARWTMAYAAGLGETDPAYLDTRRAGGVVAHPLFPVCLEWPVVLAVRALAEGALPRDELVRGVHATHDLVLHRPVRPGDRLVTTAEVIGVERRRPGAFQVVRLRTVDGDGRPVATTDMGSLFLGVDVTGDDRPAPPLDGPDLGPPEPLGAPATTDLRSPIELAANAAHVYTECSRIWNPIHTDAAVAEAAGLPGIILHGTATLALGVSAALRGADLPPTAVQRVRARFGAMVPLPSTIHPRVGAPRPVGAGSAVLPFAVDDEAGAGAVRDGALVVAVG